MADIFFSYSREDLERILPVVHALEQQGYSIFWDRTIPAGKSWREVISGELAAARCVMVAWSETSVSSRFVIEEADYGSQHSALVPLLLDPVKPPLGFGSIQVGDLTGWDGSAEAEPLTNLYRDIVSHLGPPQSLEIREPEPVAAPTKKPVSRPEMANTRSPGPGAVDTHFDMKGIIRRPTRMLLLLGSTFVGVTGVYLANRSEPDAQPEVETPVPYAAAPTETESGMHTNTRYPELVKIDTGCFRMGSTEGKKTELPLHEVCFNQPFYLGKTEVTFDEYDLFAAITGRRLPSDEWGIAHRGKHPVINVTWEDAVAYTNWLSGLTGQACRLPSESEWEYAARAGTTTEYALPAPDGSNSIWEQALANCAGCGSRWDNTQTAPVGSFQPNAWGLYDMHGNNWEWTADCWHDSYEGAPDDGSAWSSENNGDCGYRVLRGGSWENVMKLARSALRSWDHSGDRFDNAGFRVLCSGPISNH